MRPHLLALAGLAALTLAPSNQFGGGSLGGASAGRVNRAPVAQVATTPIEMTGPGAFEFDASPTQDDGASGAGWPSALSWSWIKVLDTGPQCSPDTSTDADLAGTVAANESGVCVYQGTATDGRLADQLFAAVSVARDRPPEVSCSMSPVTEPNALVISCSVEDFEGKTCGSGLDCDHTMLESPAGDAGDYVDATAEDTSYTPTVDGIYRSQLCADDGVNDPVCADTGQVTVIASGTEAPSLGLSATTVFRALNEGATTTASEIDVINDGVGSAASAIDWSATTSEVADCGGTTGTGWLSGTDSGSDLAAGDPAQTLDASYPDVDGCATGTFTGKQCVVCDGTGGDCDDDDPPQCVTHTLEVNGAPTASAGADDAITGSGTVELDSSGSTDDGLPDSQGFLTHEWTETADANGACSEILDHDTPTPTVEIVNTSGTCDMQVEVCDGLACDTDTMTITVTADDPSQPEVLELRLIKDVSGGDDEDLGVLAPGAILNTTDASYGIFPVVNSDTVSVDWDWTPPGESEIESVYTESSQPFCYAGDTGWFLEPSGGDPGIPDCGQADRDSANGPDLQQTGEHILCAVPVGGAANEGTRFCRTFTVEATEQASLSVEPSVLTASAILGGLDAATDTLTFCNDGTAGSSLDLALSIVDPVNCGGATGTDFVQLETASVTGLAGGACEDVDVTYVGSQDCAEGTGYSYTIRGVSAEADDSPKDIPGTLSATESGGGEESTVEASGISFTLDQPYTCGQYVDEHWWCLDEGSGVVVTAMSPAYAGNENGYQVNPVGPRCSDDPNNCTNSVSQEWANHAGQNFVQPPSLPLTLSAGDSLFKVEHNAATCADSNGSRDPCFLNSSVLTIVDADPAAGCASGRAFRPPFVGDEKPVICAPTDAEITSDFPTLANVSNQISLADAEAWFGNKSPWSFYIQGTRGNNGMTTNATSDQGLTTYGAGLAQRIWEMLMRTLQSGTPAQKRPLIEQLTQMGIDWYYFVENGKSFFSDGGINCGRKPVVVFANYVTGQLPSQGTNVYQEDDFIRDRDGPAGGTYEPTWGSPNRPQSPYDPTDPSFDCPHNFTGAICEAGNCPTIDGTRDAGCNRFGPGSNENNLQPTLAAQRSSGNWSMHSYQRYNHCQGLGIVALAEQLSGYEALWDDETTFTYQRRMLSPPWNGECGAFCSPYVSSMIDAYSE